MFKTSLKLSYTTIIMNIKYYSNNVSVSPSDSMCISLCFVTTSDTDQIRCFQQK